ncbi:MAG: hypothetical protein RIC18_05905 [Hoeflea sp.]|uniref:hypothetical protein n=1 Tax=Hoeflea sp. TaxID=1940281 RepID=UPI0032ECC94E
MAIARKAARLVLTLPFLAGAATAAVAACPQELAVYRGADGIGALEFTGGGAGMLSEMRLLFAGVEPVTIYLSHDDRLDRAVAMLPLNCPEGDVTGQELAACLVYQGAVYTLDRDSGVAGLPDTGDDAAQTVFLPGLASALWDNPQFDGAGPAERPAELFEISGCQE